jgi:hypothetical protein
MSESGIENRARAFDCLVDLFTIQYHWAENKLTMFVTHEKCAKREREERPITCQS